MKFFSKKTGVTQSQTLLIVGIVFLVLFAFIAVPFYNSCRQKSVVVKLRTIYTMLAQANKMYSLVSGAEQNEYETGLEAADFAKKYFVPYLNVKNECEDKQDACWQEVEYTDLGGKKFRDKITYSVILANNAVVGFAKDKNGLLNLFVDIDGKVGQNKLGYDVYVFSFYNNRVANELCAAKDNPKSSAYIKDGLHFGGYDACGVPQDVYDYKDIYGKDLVDGCNKKAKRSPDGAGVGAACSALIYKSNWTIDKIYPW